MAYIATHQGPPLVTQPSDPDLMIIFARNMMLKNSPVLKKAALRMHQ
jgi:hypothetical protein